MCLREHLHVHIVVGPIPRVAVDDGAEPRTLWVAVALDMGDGHAAGLGLYDAPPGDASILSLLDRDPAERGPPGTLWSCRCVAVTTDMALLWATPETTAWLAQRGITLHAAAPAKPGANEGAQRAFGRVAASLSRFMKRRRHAHDADRRSLVTPEAAEGAAREWRAAREAAKAGDLAG